MNKKKLVLLIAIISVIIAAAVVLGILFSGQKPETIEPYERPYNYDYSDNADYPHSDAVTIDGKLDEDIWQNKKWYQNTTTDNISGSKAKLRVTTAMDEYGIYIASETDDSNVMDVNGANTNWVFYLAAGEPGDETYSIAHKVAYDMQGILMRTMINAQVAATVRGEVNSGATEGATLELFISWKALDIDVTNGLPAYIGVQPYYYAVKSAGTGFDTIQAIYEDHVWTNRFFRFDNTGYINADADGAVLGDATYGLGKTFGWDLTDIQNGVVRSANGETHNRIFFKEFGSNFIVETTIIPVKAIDDARPRGGVVFQDTSGVYHGVFLDCYDDILTEGLNGTKNMKNLHIVTISNNNGGWNQHDFLGGIRVNSIAETTEGTKLTVIKNGRNFYYFVNDEFFYAEELDYMASDAIPGLYTIGADIIFKDYSCRTVTAEETVTYLNERNAYTVEVSSSSGGSVNAPVFVEKGKSYALSITCNAGYEVTSITVNGEEKINDARRNAKNGVYTVKNVTENQKVNVKFQKSEEGTLTGTFTYDEAAAGKNVNVVINGISNPLLHYEIAANPTKGFTAKLPSGKYDISAVKEDYMYTGTTLTVDGEASVEFKLQPSAFKWYPVVNGYTLTSHLNHWNLTNEENGSVSTSYAIGGKQAPMFFKGSGTDFVAKATINYTTTFYGDGSNYQPDLMGGFNFHIGNQEAYAMVRTSGLCITGFQIIDGLTTYNMLTYPDKIGVDYIFAKSGNDVRIYMNGVEVYKTTWRELSGGMDPNAEYVVGLFSLMDKTADIRYTNYSVNFDSDYARSFINNFSPQWKTISSLSQITNPAGLYRLSGDIKGNTSTVKNFVGKLDCMGHTIETSVPLFEKLQGATVEDLNIKLTKSITASGVLAAEGCNMTLTDIHVYGADGVTLTAPEGKDVGGLLGQMFVGETSNIKNCTNALDIVNTQADFAAGGLVGFADEWDSNFVNCKNTGTVTAVTYAGGIAGRCHKYNVVFDRCINDGVVTAQQDAGGLVGFTKWADTQKPQLFKNCVNNGTVTGYAAGGMVGRSADGFMRDVGSVNNGSVIGVGDDNRAGGILGHLQNAAAIFEGSSTGTTGKVTAVNAGGVLGYADGTDEPVLNGCVNNGTICGSAKSGGILGYAIGYDKVIELGTYNGQGCVNNGHVYGDGAEVWAGGIIGGAFQTRTKVENAVNKGTVDTADRAGGIIGFIFEGLFTANNCKNEGTVQGYNYTGDIYGTLHNMVPNIDGSGGPGYEDGELPWDGYGLAEAAQRATTYATYGNDGKTTVFVGDSFMDPGFWLPFKTDMAGYDALCLGIGGSTAEDWLNYISTGTFMHNIAPKNVVFNLGNNDIHNDGNVRAEDYAEDMQKLLTTVHEIMPEANIFMYSVAHRNASMTGQNGTVDGANALMKAWCAETEWVTFVDISDQLDTSMLDDGIHPEDKYYAEIFVPTLVSAGCVLENEQPKVATPISSLSEITDKAGEYYLTADITGNTVTLDNFAGVLDGKGFTVETTVPLFDLLSTATVKNLNVKLTVDLTAQGVLANTAETAIIQNVTVSGRGKLTAPEGKDVGGFIGTANNTTVLDSVNAIDVVGVSGGYTGGILGKVGGANGTTISGTSNSGNITSAGANAGGMIGRIDWAQNVTVTDCTNSGNISATGEGAGGILGMSAFSTGCELSNCSNAGTITNLHATEGNAGGIAGLVGHESALVISGCTNAGEIAGIESTSFNCVSGGILARASFGGTFTVKASVNNGKVSGGMSGGVVGMAWQITLTVDGCTNNGDVTAYGQDAAGVLGRVQSGARVIFRDSSNNGAVYGNTNAAQLNSYVHTPDGASITWEGDNQQNGSAGKIVGAYTIIYKGLEGATHSNPMTYTDDTAASITLVAPSQRESYTFLGWYIDAVQVTSLTGRTGDLIITAKWESNGDIPEDSQGITAFDQITDQNGKYHLTGNIIGNTTTVQDFAGTLDGKGFTVETTVPLFNQLANATVQNLNVKLTGDLTAQGVLANTAETATIQNVTVSGSGMLTAPEGMDAGGLIGTANNTAVMDSSNAVTVIGVSGGYTGGILGKIGGANGTTVDNCTNSGDISTAGNNAGGIIGRMDWAQNISITGCANTGSISAAGEGAGGILGMAAFSTGSNQITDCVNSGIVTNTNTSEGNAGGIAGIISHTSTMNISGCTNEGRVMGAECTEFNCVSGGILGRAYGSGVVTVTDCVNSAEVSGAMTGGIVGMVWESPVTVDGCTNNGDVTAYGEDSAGICGRIQSGSTVTIRDCINNGRVYGSDKVSQINSFYHDSTLKLEGNNQQNGSAGAQTATKDINVGENHTMLHIPNVGLTEYQEQLEKLVVEGFTALGTVRTVGNSRFATYVKGDTYAYAYYLDGTDDIRVIRGSKDMLPVADETVYESKYTSAMHMLGQETPGQGFVFVLPDGRLILQDGGYNYTDKGYADHVYNILKAVAPDPDNIVIAAWFISHPHDDHQDAFVEFVDKKHTDVTIQSVVYNYGEVTENYTNPSDGWNNYVLALRDRLNSLKEKGTNIIKGHTGQVYTYGDVSVEILYTVEDYLPRKYDNINSISMVIRLSIAGQTINLLADTTDASGTVLENMWGNYLKSDMVQLAHHGMYASNPSLYEKIGAEVLLWPGSKYITDNFIEDAPVVAALAPAKDVYLIGNTPGEYISLTLPHTIENNKQAFLDGLAGNGVIQTITSLSQITDSNGRYVLGGNIDSNTTTIPNFTGTLDGGGYTIFTNVPVFGALDGAHVQNLNIVLTGNIAANGALANTSSSTKITGVHVSGEGFSVSDTADCTGGLVGTASGTTFTDCSNSANVSGPEAGGIAGRTSWETSAMIGCTNTGDIAATSGSEACAGGLVGRVVFGNTTITNCINEGEVSSTLYAGGIAGYCSHEAVLTVNGSDGGSTVNRGTVTPGEYGGGVIGYAYGVTLTVADTKNEGDVTALTTSGDHDAGGVFGRLQGGAKADITGFTNSGSITGYKSGGVGGFAHGSTLKISECTNTGNIVGLKAKDFNSNSGGILGRTDGGTAVTVTDCVNSGTVVGSMAAGITAMAWESKVDMIGCTNDAEISAYGEDAAGIAGRIQSNSTVLIQDCINNGKICGNNNVSQLNAYTHVDATTSWAGDNQQNGSTAGLTVSYSITYAGLEGATHSNPTAYNNDNASQIQLTAPSARTGYTFDGWYIGTEKVTLLAGKSGDLVITAWWIQNSSSGTQGITTMGQLSGKSGEYVLSGDIMANTITVSDFTGSLDGQGYTIYTSVPLFDTLNGSDIVIENLNIVLTANLTDNGILARGIPNAKRIKNVVITAQNGAKLYAFGDSGINSNRYAGALAGSAQNVTFADCRNYVNVVGNGQWYIGGIIGASEEGGKTTLQNCYNYGNIDGDEVGGIVGRCRTGATTQITGCVNEGSITQTGSTAAGGIIGRINEGSCVVTITNCTNKGKITSKNYPAGSIVGTNGNGTVTIDNCTNSGSVDGNEGNLIGSGGATITP